MINSDINIFSAARISGKPLLLDGAMGSLLQQQYGNKGSLWTSYLNLDNPEAVFQLHQAYIEAGADIITTNTFRTNPAAMTNPEDTAKYVAAALSIAINAKSNSKVLIAGCNPPAEDCYKVGRSLPYRELENNHSRHIDLLVQNGADFILNETFSHYDEIKIVCDYCGKNNIPFIICIYFTDNFKILSGENLEFVVRFIKDNASPLAIGYNCIKPKIFLKYFTQHNFNYIWGAYFNCGAGNPSDDDIECGISPKEYGKTIKQLLINHPSFIGACCGSAPEHIKQVKKVINE